MTGLADRLGASPARRRARSGGRGFPVRRFLGHRSGEADTFSTKC